MARLGIDIGGAHLKLADGEGHAEEAYFPLWQQKDELPDAIRSLVGSMPAEIGLAVTMTGELADCYADKTEGVRSILDAVRLAVPDRDIVVYTTAGRFVSLDEASKRVVEVASANWHALATFACRFASDRTALVIDVGSTTTDLLPLVDGAVATTGNTDSQRLAHGELVYTGVRRTPVCAITSSLPWREHRQLPIAAEVFATSGDVYLTRGDLPDQPADNHTADGRPATRAAARARLARMFCADTSQFDEHDALEAAEAVHKAQLAKLGVAAQQVLRRMPTAPEKIVICGSGEFLARMLVERLRLKAEIFTLATIRSERVSRCACAHAVAVLATEADR